LVVLVSLDQNLRGKVGAKGQDYSALPSHLVAHKGLQAGPGEGEGEMMDTSEQYIKMCEKAEEIELDWQPENGDFIVIHSIHISEVTIKVFHISMSDKIEGWLKWLPRQDQLQEMIKPKIIYGNNALNLHLSLHKFLDNCLKFKIKIGYSMEQFWLAFVMKENFGKIWNGEDWVL
jgi:hypothetical protein